MRRPSTVEHRSTLVREALAVMEAAHPEPLGVSDVARRIATSRRQLQRAFHEIRGTTFRDELRGIRMRRARELLLEQPGLTIEAVAHTVGYSQAAQFAKSFREDFGVSPSALRRESAG